LKLLFDLFPVILFFLSYKLASANPAQSLALAGAVLAPLIGDGELPPDQAPILMATAIAIGASFLQVGWLALRGKRIEPMLWMSLGVIVVFGGATIWFHDEMFIKWKPTILYGLFAGTLLAGRLIWNRNWIKSLLGAQISVPDVIWDRLLAAWVAFFALMGVVNLLVAYNAPTDTWVNFKLFGLFGATLVFTLAIGIYLARHMKEADG
jgi:intracellular septation protein